MEMLIMGIGIGFHSKVGDLVPKSKIQKIYRMDTDIEVAQMKKLFMEVKPEIFQVSTDIIEFARSELKKKLNKNIYITLTDHIDFALERLEQGVEIKDMLYWETKKLYPKEFQIGVKALEMIKCAVGVALPRDEAGSIAIHIVNAEMDGDLDQTMEKTKIVEQSLDMVRFTFHMTFDENSLNYGRFVTHLLFFAQRLQEGCLLNGQKDCLYEVMESTYPKQFDCAQKIARVMGEKYQVQVPEEEITFLCVHIVRITTREEVEGKEES